MIGKVCIVGNWKMHNTLSASRDLVASIKRRIDDVGEHARIIVAPPFTALAVAQQEIGSVPISLASQNISYASAGAHTGEISATMLADLGVQYAIVGHSERRHLYGEDDAMIAKRAACAIQSDITPIICVGETLAERESGVHTSVCERQLAAALEHIDRSQIGDVIIAYEPVWAINTGKTASPSDAEEMHAYLRRSLAKLSDQSVADNMGILYGGSVKPDNSAALLGQQNIDGVLVGGASLDADSFMAIARSAS